LNRDPEKLEIYHNFIREQLESGIIERADSTNCPKHFFITHKMVTREDAKTTKNRVVFDASAKANEHSPSLNDCLETGPSLNNQLWSILVRMRFKPIVLTVDLKKAFLQIRIRKEDRGVLQFHWINYVKN